jgi:hypothetical protein
MYFTEDMDVVNAEDEEELEHVLNTDVTATATCRAQGNKRKCSRNEDKDLGWSHEDDLPDLPVF